MSELKIYQFDFNGTISGYGIVTAKNEEEAKEKIINHDYDDIIDELFFFESEDMNSATLKLFESILERIFSSIEFLVYSSRSLSSKVMSAGSGYWATIFFAFARRISPNS